jgi:hypothetical protein
MSNLVAVPVVLRIIIRRTVVVMGRAEGEGWGEGGWTSFKFLVMRLLVRYVELGCSRPLCHHQSLRLRWVCLSVCDSLVCLSL